jgi:hypothetical protein
MRPSAMLRRLPTLVAGLLLLLQVTAARADAGWLESGDTRLRLDLQLLNDAGIIRLPVNQWPLPRAAVQYALGNAKEHLATNSAVMVVLERVRQRMQPPTGSWALQTGARGGQPGLWRDFDTLAREDGEINAGFDYDQGRFSLGLEVTGAIDPADGDELRADGSHATVQWGNWLLSANMLDRWWGPGHEGSLILSNNARPMPTLMVERAEARPWETSWLSWLGPWRFSFGISQMENERADVDAPLFMAWRVVVMPFRDVELGFSRTAQFCGDDQPCSLRVFGDLIAGNDNPGFDSTVQTEPGNQMAGFDIRWNSPIGNLPYAIYGQYIGEDESSYLPAKYLSQLGMEFWKPLSDGALFLGYAEYAATTCSANSSGSPYYNCAYNQGRFNVEGYRYKGRVIGYPSDRDAENYAIGAKLTGADGTLWTGTLRGSRFNRDDYNDITNSVASVPTDYYAVELGWKGRLFGERIAVDLGVEAIEPEGGERNNEVFGFVGWQHDFQP